MNNSRSTTEKQQRRFASRMRGGVEKFPSNSFDVNELKFEIYTKTCVT
jgi:hypothetical protein